MTSALMTQTPGTPAGTNYGLIGRSYPCEAFELLFQVSRITRERRKVSKAAYRLRDKDLFKRVSAGRHDAPVSFSRRTVLSN